MNDVTTFDLRGKVALITGAGRGVGVGIAAALAGQGAPIAVNDLSADSARNMAESLAAAGHRAHAVPFDVSDRNPVEAGVAAATVALGPVDILVNNAGKGGQYGIGQALFQSSGPEQWEGPLAVDFRGTLYCTRPSSSRCAIGAGGGSSASRQMPGPVRSAWPKDRRLRLRRGKRCRCIDDAPRRYRDRTARRDRQYLALGLMEGPPGTASRTGLGADIPAGRLGRTANVGSLCIYLASPEASWMTGQTIHLTGGHVTT